MCFMCAVLYRSGLSRAQKQHAGELAALAWPWNVQMIIARNDVQLAITMPGEYSHLLNVMGT
jgi:hypothetical protein